MQVLSDFVNELLFAQSVVFHKDMVIIGKQQKQVANVFCCVCPLRHSPIHRKFLKVKQFLNHSADYFFAGAWFAY